MSKNRCRALILTFGPPQTTPWWSNHIDAAAVGCDIDYARISLGRKYAMNVGVWELPLVLLKVARVLFAARKTDYLFTFECDLTSFAVALLQTLTFTRRPRHVILQFIMREKTARLSSRLKYLFMRFCFRSVHRVVCSSRAEADYYRRVFGWNDQKTAYVPFHTHPALLRDTPTAGEGYIIAAGRSFRDYPTFLSAVAGLPTRVIVVASPSSMGNHPVPANVELRFDIPSNELNVLLEGSQVVVLPLEERKISTGQSVLLQAMSLGKAVVSTRTAGTEDYVRDGVDGMLVPPRDPAAMRTAIESLLRDPQKREQLAANAIRTIRKRHLPQQYLMFVADAIV